MKTKTRRNKGGRPPLKPSERASENLHVMLQPDTMHDLRDEARRQDKRTSVLVREIIEGFLYEEVEDVL